MKSEHNHGFYERLLTLPLFQGVSRSDFLEIAERIRIGFSTIGRGKHIATQDERCNELIFMLRGEMCLTRQSNDHAYSITEWTGRPTVVQPECLFGLSTCYTHSYTSARTTELIKIDKAAVRDILFFYPTFRINYLNLLSSQSQRALSVQWRPMPQTLRDRFVTFVATRCLRPAGHKQLSIKMEDLAKELLDTRLNVSRMLHVLEEEGLLTIKRCCIDIPALEQLLINH